MRSPPTSSFSHLEPVHGNMLSCFTASLSAYLSYYEIDYIFAFGLQCYLATKFEEQGELKGSFIHHHRPLVGNFPFYTLHLTRCWMSESAGVQERLLQEWEKMGRLLIIGDAFHLPWQVSYGRKHAPHWFLIEEIDKAGQRIYVHDCFEFIDENVTQTAYSGWLPLSALVDLAKVYAHPPFLYLARDLHATGVEEHVPLEAYRGYQWFEAGEVAAHGLSKASLMQELVDTFRHMRGTLQREDLRHSGWRTGLEAVENMSGLFQEHLTNPALYAMRDDFWVIGRQRQLFAYALRRAAQLMNQPQLETLAHWCDETLVPCWAAIPRLMLYNSSLLKRQRPLRDTLIRQVEAAYQAERECVQRLEECLYSAGIPDFITGSACDLDREIGEFDALPGGQKAAATLHKEPGQDLSLPGNGETLQAPNDRAEASDGLPRTPLEKVIADVWMSILNLRTVKIYDDFFFELHGNSLQAMQILSRLREMFPVEISILTFTEVPTIAQTSLLLEQELLKLIRSRKDPDKPSRIEKE